MPERPAEAEELKRLKRQLLARAVELAPGPSKDRLLVFGLYVFLVCAAPREAKSNKCNPS